MRTLFARFAREEGGAVTADWVVLTAAIVGLGLAIVTTVSAAVMAGSNDVSSDLSAAVNAGGALGDAEEPMTGEEFLAAFSPLSPRHGSSWARGAPGQTWAQAAYSRMSAMSDSDLMGAYNRNYSRAADGTSPTRADRVAVASQVMAERGMAAPSGNKSASEIRAMYQ